MSNPQVNPTTAVGEHAEATAPATLLEAGFPFLEVSEVARRDRFCVDHTYAVHKWWARRPPAVIRALLIASVMPPQASAEEFWARFGSDERHLVGMHVGDPFMGGATTLVEASRLGADVTGIDVDPLAIRVARVELQELDGERFERAGQELLIELRRRHDALYPSQGAKVPLHYFWLRETDCPHCGEHHMIHRDLWLARDRGRAGAVVHDEEASAFCPECLAVHHIGAGRKVLRCCGHDHRLDRGTYGKGRFTCPSCAGTATNEQLRVGLLPLRLIAVEQTESGRRRSLRAPLDADLAAVEKSASGAFPEHLRQVSLVGVDSGRPASYGFGSVADLFHPRQARVLGDAFEWIAGCEEPGLVKDALAIAVSNALGSNNVLCGYATEYGRLSSLFTAVRAYSVPILSAELNPLHPIAGRGTLAATIRRVARSANTTVRRNAVGVPGEVPAPNDFPASGTGRRVVRCRSAERALPLDHGHFDLVLTDPPYFDFIPYSDLSLLYRAWSTGEGDAIELGGTPIYPVGEDPAAEFATRLARAFRNVRRALKEGGPLVFTFHSPHRQAWDTVETALREGGFAVHAVFPLWADGRSGSHGHAGNCEWDLVFVCREDSLAGPPLEASLEGWEAEIGEEKLEASDRASMSFGLELARRLGR